MPGRGFLQPMTKSERIRMNRKLVYTAAFTAIVFALFDLLGMQFSPRIRNIGKQQISCFEKSNIPLDLIPLVSGSIKEEFIQKYWDDLLRITGSLKHGWVSASLFISKLKSYPRQNNLAKALQEYGKIVKSIFILMYLSREDYQRGVNRQLNKGESLHDLRRFLFFANENEIRKSNIDDQTNQASCLTLVTNAVIIWNTKYIHAIIDQLEKEGATINSEDIKHILPCRFEHINKYGRYIFDLENRPEKGQLRTLRNP